MALKKCKECGKEVSSAAKVCPHCGKKYPTGGFTIPVKIVLTIFGLYFISLVINSMNNSPTSSNNSPTTVLTEKDIANSLIVDYKWSKGGFDNIMIADFTIANPTDHTVKDLEITCTHFAKSGTQIDSNKRTIFDTLPANSKKVFEDFNMGFIHNQVESSDCICTNLIKLN